MRSRRVALLLLLSFCTIAVSRMRATSSGGDQRPKILGIAHVALYVSNLQKSRAFYQRFLGYQEPYSLKRADGSDRIAFIKINDNQYLELFSDPPKNDGRLNHVAFYTDSAEAMRRYLASRDIHVSKKVAIGKIGNASFTVIDPDGHSIEFVQYLPNGWTRQNAGKYLSDTRISTRLAHAAFTVGLLQTSLDYYSGVLGLREFWRGSASGKTLSWVNLRVPDGDDYIELMLGGKPPDAKQLGVKNHICLFVPDIHKAVAELQARAERAGYTRPIDIKIGVNGKRQANLFDPDGTRIELMEPETANGRTVPSSTAPPPP